MPDYKEMYTYLFNKVTDAIRELQEAQQHCEETFVKQEEKPPIFLQVSDEEPAP